MSAESRRRSRLRNSLKTRLRRLDAKIAALNRLRAALQAELEGSYRARSAAPTGAIRARGRGIGRSWAKRGGNAFLGSHRAPQGGAGRLPLIREIKNMGRGGKYAIGSYPISRKTSPIREREEMRKIY